MVAPWTSWWRRNYFAEVVPAIRTFLASDAAVVLVVAAGALTAIAGVSDLHALLFRRLRHRLPMADVSRDR